MNSPTNQTQQRNIYAVIGFARSGSSLITRGLKALGIDLGDKLVDFEKTNRWNAKGFWEDKEIIFDIYVKTFAALEYGKRGILLMDKNLQLSSKLDAMRNSASQLLEKRFLSTHYYGFKNPNTSKILPFWQSIFSKMNIKDHYIITLRNPLASAKSFSFLTELDLEVCLLLWLMHTIPAVEETHGRDRLVVSYELMMQDPHKQLQRIKNKLQIPSLADQNEIDIFANEFLDKKLNRHPFNDADLKTHPAMSAAPLCLTVYELLYRVAQDELSFDSPEFNSSWKNIMTELEKIYPLYCLLDKVLRQNKVFKRSIRQINKSFIWKLLYPLRYIDDKLRAIRTKNRSANKRVVTAYE